MNSSLIQLLVLVGIAIFLILRLKSVLGSRTGYERPRSVEPVERENVVRRDFDVIEGGPDRDITDHVEESSDQAEALARMKGADPEFSVSEFLEGARAAYEMIVIGFEHGKLEDIRPFLADDVFETFESVVKTRQEQGIEIQAEFIGVREIAIADAQYDHNAKTAEISVRFVGELTFEMRDKDGALMDGNARDIKRQKDTWTFARNFGHADPNWSLVATGE